MNRFDLEDAIMKLWQTTDDLNLVCGSLSEDSEDGILNKLNGIAELHDLRVKKVWEIFENLVHADIITSEDTEDTADQDVLGSYS